MSWLVTGGAGYIGAHVVRAFAGGRGWTPWSSTTSPAGTATSSGPTCRSSQGSIVDTDLLVRRPSRATRSRASCTSPGSSTPASRSTGRCTPTRRTSPARSACSRRWSGSASDTIVFSSSAATFGTPTSTLVTEETPTVPESPYGESKLIGEWVIRDQARATGLRHTSLRYFNVVGSGSPTTSSTPARTTCSRSSSRCSWPGRRRGSTATTTTPPTAPACATTSTSPTSPSRTSWPRSGSRPVSTCSPSTTSAAATAPRSRRS